jgi:hypothetical protein
MDDLNLRVSVSIGCKGNTLHGVLEVTPVTKEDGDSNAEGTESAAETSNGNVRSEFRGLI